MDLSQLARPEPCLVLRSGAALPQPRHRMRRSGSTNRHDCERAERNRQARFAHALPLCALRSAWIRSARAAFARAASAPASSARAESAQTASAPVEFALAPPPRILVLRARPQPPAPTVRLGPP